MHDYPEKCHSDEAKLEMILVERGKPCERETQIWWGSLGLRKWTKDQVIVFDNKDRWLLKVIFARITGTKRGL